MLGKTTCFALFSPEDPILNGDEFYNIYGPNLQEIMDGSEASVAKIVHTKKMDIMAKMKGLNRWFSCVEKAILLRRFIGSGVVTIGGCFVWNNKRDGNYGHAYNPPYEFHAWLEVSKQPFIVDFGLPGVIESGLNTKDQFGYILEDVEPVILCGPIPEWTMYQAREYLNEEDEKLLATKFNLDKL